ncbi:MAG: hypothetical protein ACK5TK_17355 [Betaproteobacteria bacterium]
MSEAMQHDYAQCAPINDAVYAKPKGQAGLHALLAGIATHARLRRGEHFWQFPCELAA